MKIAVCFSGQWRTGNLCYKNITNFLGFLYPMCDFFIHTWNINKQKCYNLSNVFSKETALSEEEIQQINKNYNPKKIKIDDYKLCYDEFILEEEHRKKNIFKKIIQPLYYSFAKSIEIKRKYEIENNFLYDYVLKLRPDVIFHPNRKLSQDIEMYDEELNDGRIYIENLSTHRNEDTTGVGRADDVYFLSKSKQMDIASNYYFDFLNNSKEERSLYEIDNHCVKNDVKICSFKKRKFGGESGYTILRPECISYIMDDFDKCRECEDFYYGNPANGNINGYYINFLKERYKISDDVDYYIDELK